MCFVRQLVGYLIMHYFSFSTDLVQKYLYDVKRVIVVQPISWSGQIPCSSGLLSLHKNNENVHFFSIRLYRRQNLVEIKQQKLI